MRRTVHAALAIAAAVLLVGCTGGEGDPAQLPPQDPAALRSLYDDELAGLGWRLTTRGGLVDATTYEPDPDGTHLSLYVEPTGERDDQDYIDGLLSVTALFAEDAFSRWPALASFDVCQEAVATGEDVATARTQVTLTREAAAPVDWTTATLRDLADAINGSDESGLVLLDEQLRERLRQVLPAG